MEIRVNNLPVQLNITRNRLGGLDDCWLCCSPTKGGDTFEDHHIIPRHLGGENGPLVYLHSNCHTNVHAVASALIRGKAVPELYEDARIQDRLLTLGLVIFRANTALKNTGKLDQMKKTKLAMELDPRINQKLKELARHLGMSQDKTIKYAIELAHSLRLGLQKRS